jgi:hypothetical protein
MMVVHLDRLAPYQGAARDERPYGRSGGRVWRIVAAKGDRTKTSQTEASGKRGTGVHR